VHREAVQTAAAAHELQAVLHRAGNVTDQVLALERVGETRARLELAAAEQREAEAMEPLQALLGLWGADTDWTLAPGLDPQPLRDFDLDAIESRAIASSLDLAAHREGLDALAQQAGLDSWRSWFPELVLGPNGIRVPGGRVGFGPRLEGELPLFDLGGPRRARAAANLQAGMHDHVQLAVEIRSVARRLRQRLTSLAAQVAFLRDEHLPQREQVVRTTLQTYNAMQIGAFDVLAQRQLQLRDRAEAVRTLQRAHRARLALQQLLAGGMPDLTDGAPEAANATASGAR
jgi:outer membrane protein, heavy metal efflux system